MRPTETNTQRRRGGKRRPHTGRWKRKRKKERKWNRHLRCKIKRIAPVCASIDFDSVPSWCARHKLTNRARRRPTGPWRPDQNGQIRHVWSFPPFFFLFIFFYMWCCYLQLFLLYRGTPPARRRASFYSFVPLFLFLFLNEKKEEEEEPARHHPPSLMIHHTSLFFFFFFFSGGIKMKKNPCARKKT